MTAPTRVRRTQAERTATTRAALLDATVDCLVDGGFSRTTTTEVARRAGVSLGALLHHFPTKIDLLTAAVGHVTQRRLADFRKAMANLDPGVDRLTGSIDLLWEAMDSPAFVAWLELWVAARTDPELAPALRRVTGEFEQASRETFAELFPPDEYPDPRFLEQGYRFSISVMDGVALRSLLVRPVDTGPIEILKLLAAERVERRTDDQENR